MKTSDKEKLKEFAARLRGVMNDAGIDAFILSDWTDISENTILSWCMGRCYPQVNNLEAICDTLRVSADYLLFGKESR